MLNKQITRLMVAGLFASISITPTSAGTRYDFNDFKADLVQNKVPLAIAGISTVAALSAIWGSWALADKATLAHKGVTTFDGFLKHLVHQIVKNPVTFTTTYPAVAASVLATAVSVPVAAGTTISSGVTSYRNKNDLNRNNNNNGNKPNPNSKNNRNKNNTRGNAENFDFEGESNTDRNAWETRSNTFDDFRCVDVDQGSNRWTFGDKESASRVNRREQSFSQVAQSFGFDNVNAEDDYGSEFDFGTNFRQEGERCATRSSDVPPIIQQARAWKQRLEDTKNEKTTTASRAARSACLEVLNAIDSVAQAGRFDQESLASAMQCAKTAMDAALAAERVENRGGDNQVLGLQNDAWEASRAAQHSARMLNNSTRVQAQPFERLSLNLGNTENFNYPRAEEVHFEMRSTNYINPMGTQTANRFKNVPGITIEEVDNEKRN